MALTKVILSGAVNTIKEAWTKFNALIDDLASVVNGLGASTIGVQDAAGNLSATNVETAIAEIYTDHASTRTLAEIFDENPATTAGLTWGFKAGAIRVDNVVTDVSAGTLSLTDDDVNYVEIDQTGAASRNTTSFTSGSIPIRQITTASGVQTVSTDKRAWFVQIGSATETSEGSVELATDTETQTGTATDKVITPANLTARTATTARTGIVEIATDGEAVTGTSDAVVMTPGTSTAQLAEPPAIGGTTAAAGDFTTLSASELITATGGQIAFPASQNASADANTLDDYEEGYHTPVTVVCSTSGSYVVDSSFDNIAYTKVGREVHYQGFVQINSESSPNGTIRVSLPFAAASLNESTGISIGSATIESHGGAHESISFRPIAGASYGRITNVTDAGVQSDLDHNDVDTAWQIRFSGSYITT